MAMHSQHTRLHWEVSALAEVAAESDCQHSHKLTTCAEIEALARKLWGDSVSVAHHGSTHSGASLRGSDLDVVLCKIRDLPKPDNPGGNGYLVHSREMVASYLDSLKKILDEETTLVSDIEIVRTARMPLLKGKLSGGIELKATLSPLDVSDIPACQTAELVSETFKELPHARKILLILKALMRPPNCLNSLVGVHTGGVSSYTITLMVLAFCKFQAAQLNVSNVDLGSLFLSFLQFYSEPNHFDVTRHAIDVVVPSGFAQKHVVQAHLDADVRQEMADRLCALEPISRHDIGQNSYRIKQVFEEMGGLRVHLASMNPYLSAGEADIEALRIMSDPRSYRTAVTPRQPEAAASADTTFTSTWVERYLPLLSTILDVASIVPVKQETPSASGVPKAPPPQPKFPPGAVFVPGYGAMTLGQVSLLSAQEAPLMGPRGHFGPDAFPTLQESVNVEANKSPTQGRSSPRSSRSSPNGRAHSQSHAAMHGMHGGHMHGAFPGHAMYGVYAPHLAPEHSFPGMGRKGGHSQGPAGNGPMSRGNSVPNQYGRRGSGPPKTYHNRNHSFGSSNNHTSFGAQQTSHSTSAERGKPADTKAQPGGRNSSPKRRNGNGNGNNPHRKPSPKNVGSEQPGMDRNGSATQLRESQSKSWRDRSSAAAAPDGACEAASASACKDASNGSDSGPLPSEVPPEELRAEGAAAEAQSSKRAADMSFEKQPLDSSLSRGTIESSIGVAGSSSASTAALSMRSKSVGTASSSAVSPMMLPLSPHGIPAVGSESATQTAEPAAPSEQTPNAARVSDSDSTPNAAQQESKDKDSVSSESASTPGAAVATAKRSDALQPHMGGEGRGDARAGTGFQQGGGRRFNSQNSHGNAPWGGRGEGRGRGRFKDRGGRDGGAGGRHSFNPGGGTGASQGHHSSWNNGGRGSGRWGGARPQHAWNNYAGGAGHASAQRGHMPPHGGPAGMPMVPLQLPVYPGYPSHSPTSPYVAPYYVMQGPQTPPGHTGAATSAPDASAPPPAASNGAQPRRQSSAQPDESAQPQPPPGGAGAGAAPSSGAAPPSQSEAQRGGGGGGKPQASGELPQHAAQLPAAPVQPGGMPQMSPMMLLPNHGPPGQGAPAGGALQQAQSHRWPTRVVHPPAMVHQHPGEPPFMPQTMMYVALPAQHMQQMPHGSHSMPHTQFRHPGRGGGGGGAQGGVPHREHHSLRSNSGKHQGSFDVPNGHGRGRGRGRGEGRGEGQGGRGSWNADGGRGGFGRGAGRSRGFGRNSDRPMGGRWRGEQQAGPQTPEAMQG